MCGATRLLLGVVLLAAAEAQILEIFGLSTGDTGTVEREPFHDLASQSVGLINYLQSVQKNPNNALAKKLKEPLPQVQFIDGLPVIPGVVGSLPGAGACLPKGSMLVKQKSPSFFQNFVRNIPGVQDYLSSLLPTPDIQHANLLGKYMWAIDTPAVHQRFCPTTEFTQVAQAGNTSSFSVAEAFRTESEEGGEKHSFGYGLIHRKQVFVYFQDDPCPYQIVLAGPKNTETGQYEYLILSNWARFPIIGLVRDIRSFYKTHKDRMEADLEKEGFLNPSTDAGQLHYTDWSQCRPATPISYIRNVLKDIFGK